MRLRLFFEYFDNSSSMDSTTPSATEENNGRDGAELSGGVSSLMSSLPKSLLKNRFDPSVLKRAWEATFYDAISWPSKTLFGRFFSMFSFSSEESEEIYFSDSDPFSKN